MKTGQKQKRRMKNFKKRRPMRQSELRTKQCFYTGVFNREINRPRQSYSVSRSVLVDSQRCSQKFGDGMRGATNWQVIENALVPAFARQPQSHEVLSYELEIYDLRLRLWRRTI